ncbi:MAG: formylglycine-generating enzyme family protein [Bacteroidales bacterium]|nr:formylglycine-generating enzyme family protein [Bacteroidales bacterium]
MKDIGEFYIGECEVTQLLWLVVMGKYPDADFIPNDSNGLGKEYPMYYVSYKDIVGTSGGVGYNVNGINYYKNGFCYKLSRLVGNGMKFRLPSDMEWEFAAKGGKLAMDSTEYSGSNDLENVGWYDGNSGNRAQRVKTKQANILGVYDMSGNVWEYCSSNSCNGYDEIGLRGGSYLTSANACSVYYRACGNKNKRSSRDGFRLACSKNKE